MAKNQSDNRDNQSPVHEIFSLNVNKTLNTKENLLNTLKQNKEEGDQK